MSPQEVKFLSLLNDQLLYVLVLVNNILDVEMLNNGVFEPKSALINVNASLGHALAMFQFESQARKIDLSLVLVSAEALD